MGAAAFGCGVMLGVRPLFGLPMGPDMKSISCAAALLVGLISAVPLRAQTTSLTLDPQATFLHVSADPSAFPAAAFSVAALGLTPGGWCSFEQLGDWRAGGGFADIQRELAGVFSSTAVLLSGSATNRVPDATPAGTPLNTGTTLYNAEPTNIDADFWISRGSNGPYGTIVRVPLGAQFVFFAALDSYYGDNFDPDGDFKVAVTPLPAPPAPGTADGLVILSGVNAAPLTGFGSELKSAGGGDLLTLRLDAPFFSYTGGLAFFGVQIVGAADPFVNPLSFPELWIDPFAPSYLALFPSLDPLPSGGTMFAATLPPGLAGLAIVVQGVVISPATRNGAYSMPDAHRVTFL